MEELDSKELVKAMLQGAKVELEKFWGEVKTDLQEGFTTLGKQLIYIQKLKITGDIDEQTAKELTEFIKSAIRIKLEKIKGIGKVTAENAINAALNLIKQTVNTAIGWDLV